MKDHIGYLFNASPKNSGSPPPFQLLLLLTLTNLIIEYIFRLHNLAFFVRYEMQDLHVAETLPQMVALSEAYMQIYEQQQQQQPAQQKLE